jgi:hypothetical protein
MKVVFKKGQKCYGRKSVQYTAKAISTVCEVREKTKRDRKKKHMKM